VVRNTPDSKREFFRFFTGGERLALQGFPPDILKLLPAAVVNKAAGNAYPVVFIVAVTHPVLALLGTTPGFDLASWPTQTSRCVPIEVRKLVMVLKGRDKQLAVPKKASKARRKRKRCSSDSS
jgi:hypothetical protein